MILYNQWFAANTGDIISTTSSGPEPSMLPVTPVSDQPPLYTTTVLTSSRHLSIAHTPTVFTSGGELSTLPTTSVVLPLLSTTTETG